MRKKVNPNTLYYKNRKILVSKLPKQCVCPYCNVKMDKVNKKLPSSITVDHIIPRSKGGQDTLDNLIIVCANCNTKKASLEEANLFYLSEPRFLRAHDFKNLNAFVRFSNRYNFLLEIKKLISEESLIEAVELIQNQMKTSIHTRFFKRMLTFIRNFINKTMNFKENLRKCLQWLKNLIVSEKNLIDNLSQYVKHIQFSSYSIISSKVQEQLISKAA